MKPGRVSIVIPCYNQARTLPCTVDHVMHQDWPDLELIVVDGGSTDDTKAWLADLAERVAGERADYLDHLELPQDGEPRLVRREVPRYPQSGRRLKILSFPEDIGPTQTYNQGFRRVTGEYAGYVVGDDIPQFHFVRRLVETLERTGADFAYSDMALVDDAGRVLQVFRKPDYDPERCLADWYHLGVSHIHRTALHRRVGLFDTAYQSANDYDLALRFAQAGARFVHLPEVLYSVRDHGPQPTSGQHTPDRMSRLMQESVRCALRARQWLERERAATQAV